MPQIIGKHTITAIRIGIHYRPRTKNQVIKYPVMLAIVIHLHGETPPPKIIGDEKHKQHGYDDNATIKLQRACFPVVIPEHAIQHAS